MTTYILIATYNYSQVWSFSVTIYLTTYGLLQLLIFDCLVFCAWIVCLCLPHRATQLPIVTLFCMPIYMTYSPSSLLLLLYAYLQSTMTTQPTFSAAQSTLWSYFTMPYLVFIITAWLNVAQSMLPILMLLSALLTSSQLYSLSGLHGYPVCYA